MNSFEIYEVTSRYPSFSSLFDQDALFVHLTLNTGRPFLEGLEEMSKLHRREFCKTLAAAPAMLRGATAQATRPCLS